MVAKPRWVEQFQESSITVGALLEEVGLRAEQIESGVDYAPQFRIKAPPHFRSLIRKGDPNDPLLRQVLALGSEIDDLSKGSKDPVEESRFYLGTGTIQKYANRLLVLLSGACAIHCRYCFRRHYPYGDLVLGPQELGALSQLLKKDLSLREVILSGGDPLSVTDQKLARTFEVLDSVEHLQIIRIHTRLPTTIPERVTEELIDLISGCTKKVVIVIHTNHSNELDSRVLTALAKLHQSGSVLLNQAVLLKGVNDNLEALTDHCWRLIQCRVLPYYIHLADAVLGGTHFCVDDEFAIKMRESLRRRLPGYLVPRFVREIPGKPYKVALGEVDEPILL
jgi:EF-P beta-lysylation protein EpmB